MRRISRRNAVVVGQPAIRSMIMPSEPPSPSEGGKVDQWQTYPEQMAIADAQAISEPVPPPTMQEYRVPTPPHYPVYGQVHCYCATDG